MSTGNIHIYNIDTQTVSSVVIRFGLLFPDRKGDYVADMKVNPQMMHRMLIAYEETAVVMYSLNKHRDIQRVVFSEFEQDKGRALAVEFLPTAEMFIVGYSSGVLRIYNCEGKNQKKAQKVLDINAAECFNMQISIVERANLYHSIVVQFQKETEGERGRRIITDIVVMGGKYYEKCVSLSTVVSAEDMANDEFYMSCAGNFMLQSKY